MRPYDDMAYAGSNDVHVLFDSPMFLGVAGNLYMETAKCCPPQLPEQRMDAKQADYSDTYIIPRAPTCVGVAVAGGAN